MDVKKIMYIPIDHNSDVIFSRLWTEITLSGFPMQSCCLIDSFTEILVHPVLCIFVARYNERTG